MAAPVFIGDEVTAAGFRMGGARVVPVRPGEAAEAFDRALVETDLVLIGVSAAAELPEAAVDAALRVAPPLVLVVPDAASTLAMPDLAGAAERALGISE